MSQYRGERDALRARAEGLEQQLTEVRGELQQTRSALHHAQQSTPWERLEQLERDLATAQKAVLELRGQMSSTVRPAPRANGAAVAAGMVALILAGTGTALILAARAGNSEPPPRRTTVTWPPPTPAAQTPLAGATGKVPSAVTPAPERIEARWNGQVVSASGLKLAPGTACSAEATLLDTHEQGALGVDALTVRCGGQDVYRSSDDLNGISMLRSGASTQESEGRKSYTLVYDDTGDRTGDRNQISLSTSGREARIWRATVPTFDLRLRLEPLASGTATNTGF
ncbi:hypothetical protein [Chondromyces crocatus]|uniref:Uncharacterized protein n=1 Tax=Chondromyces crocatus TaxID=52 RepID=A0A0K1ELT6_CHOCO|nr:hypothetical protein [Chondromyces crocatus]AKT41791.1 uncharacterized protein CMC5_060020 [Chondromyces crocatus]